MKSLQYRGGVIPEDSRFANHKDLFKNSLEGWNSEEGKAKFEKIDKLADLAEKGKYSETKTYRHIYTSLYFSELGCKLSHLALAWIAKKPATSTVILGASKPEQVVDNLKALEIIPKITPEIEEKIEKILGNKPTPEVSGI